MTPENVGNKDIVWFRNDRRRSADGQQGVTGFMVIYTCTKIQSLGPKALSDAVCNPFVKRMYRPGPDVSNGFCGLFT